MIVLIILLLSIIAYAAVCVPIYVGCWYKYKYKGVTELSAPKDRLQYYLLQFTWGLPMNIIGCCAAIWLLCRGHKPKKYGWNYCFELPVKYGLELGIFFIAPTNGSTHTKNHEVGHAVQNIYLGPFTVGVISIPSAIRYWVRYYKQKKGKTITTKYDDIWFEGQATKTGFKFIEEIKERED